MEHIDLLLEEINAQRQFLIERKRMLAESDPGSSFNKISNSLKEIGHSRQMGKPDSIIITHNFRFQKNKVLPAISNSPQDHSFSQVSHNMDNYCAIKSNSTIYESIIALYKNKSKSLRPRSANSNKVAVAVSENPIQPSNANNASTEKAKSKGKYSQKKPAFCIRKSDALFQMPPVSRTTGATTSVVVSDDDNRMDENLEIFASMISKQQSTQNGNVTATDSSSNNQKATKIPVGGKKSSSLPSYVAQFPPALSVPFLPSKTKRILRQNCNNGGILDISDAVVDQPLEEIVPAERSQSKPIEWFKEEPYRSKRMDVIVTVEHCCDCDDHQQSTHHDAKRYVERANDVLYSIIDLISSGAMVDSEDENFFPVRLFCMRMKRSSPDRLGAFEVTVAVNVTPPISEQSGGSKRFGKATTSSMKQSTTITEEESDSVGDSVWATHLVYSKLQTKCWPSAGAVQEKVKQFLLAVLSDERKKQQALDTQVRRRAMLNQSNENNEGSHHKRTEGQPNLMSDIMDTKTAKINAVDESYLKWVDRMRIPPKVERHPLDFDWPTLEEGILMRKKASSSPWLVSPFAAVAKCMAVKLSHEHPRGPYIDLGLMEHMTRVAFEDCVLKHFEVVDMTV